MFNEALNRHQPLVRKRSLLTDSRKVAGTKVYRIIETNSQLLTLGSSSNTCPRYPTRLTKLEVGGLKAGSTKGAKRDNGLTLSSHGHAWLVLFHKAPRDPVQPCCKREKRDNTPEEQDH